MCPTTRFWCGLARKGSRLVAHSQIGDMAAANHSARQQEWAQLEINQPKPESRLIEDKSGEEWWLTPASPGHNTPFEHFVAVLVLFSWFGAMWAMPWTTLATVYFACKGNVIAWTVIAIMTGLSLLPAGKEWKTYRYGWVWSTWHRYFQLKFLHPPLPFLAPDKRYLVAQFPHAVYPMAGWLTFSHVGTRGSGVPGGLTAGIADVFFRLPIIKHNYAWSGSVSADKRALMRELKQHTCALLPEGIAGIFLGASVERERIFIKSRKGFVKLAIQAGVDIIPTYTLGASQLLTFKGSAWLSRKLQISLGVFWGWRFTPIPRPHPMITLVGRPIPAGQLHLDVTMMLWVTQNDSPSDKEVAQLHSQVVATIEAMYYRHRHLVPGFETRPLIIA